MTISELIKRIRNKIFFINGLEYTHISEKLKELIIYNNKIQINNETDFNKLKSIMINIIKSFKYEDYENN